MNVEKKVTPSNVPQEVPALEGLTAWPIFIPAENLDAEEDFNSKLSALLQAEEKPVEDVQALLAGPQPVSSSIESILCAVGNLLDETAKQSLESEGYRHLRIFSGAVPSPAGEEQFDH